jgi:AmiR/NasT family two-component response regulator
MTIRWMREEEAYRFICNQPIARRISIGALVTAIVGSADVLG